MTDNNQNQKGNDNKLPNQQQGGQKQGGQGGMNKPGAEPVRSPGQGGQQGDMNKGKVGQQDQSFGDKRGGIEGDPSTQKKGY